MLHEVVLLDPLLNPRSEYLAHLEEGVKVTGIDALDGSATDGGELLVATEKNTGTRVKAGVVVERSDRQTLADMGLTKDESSRYQQLAAAWTHSAQAPLLWLKTQPQPAVQAVVHNLSGDRAIGHLRPELQQPLVQRLRDRRRARSSLSQATLGWQVFYFALDAVELPVLGVSPFLEIPTLRQIEFGEHAPDVAHHVRMLLSREFRDLAARPS